MKKVYRMALVGSSLGHSISPWIHYDIMDARGIEGTYEMIEINQVNFQEKFFGLIQGKYDGLNITLPYKQDVIMFMDNLSDEAKKIGAVNTIRIRNGVTTGYNTDYYGFLEMMREHAIDIKNKTFTILGTGGAALAVIHALKDNGAADIQVVSRSKASFMDIKTINYAKFQEDNPFSDCIVNCTPVGMFPRTSSSPLSADNINCDALVDLIYNPETTALMENAMSSGIKAVNGLIMLKKQAEKAWELWV